MNILHVDENHPLLLRSFEKLGHTNKIAYTTPLAELWDILKEYQGLIIRSRFPINADVIDQAKNLKFIGRLGAGLENIDLEYAQKKGIVLFAAPEGNQNAVGEHCLALLLSLFNKLRQGHQSIQNGNWIREAHRGTELAGKTVGIIGYGYMGKSFAQKLAALDAEVLCHDRLPNKGDRFAKQVSLETLQSKAEVISIHTDQNPTTQPLIDSAFIDAMQHPFWLLNTARGSAVNTEALVNGLEQGKIIGAGLDVLEYESLSFHSIFNQKKQPKALTFLLQADNVLLSPHVGGWTIESHARLATTIVEKFINHFHQS